MYLFYASNIELSSGIQVLLLYIWQYFEGACLNISYHSKVTSNQIKNVRTFKVYLLTDAISHAISYNRKMKPKQSNDAMLLF